MIDADAGGEPTGLLKESAQAVVQGLIPPATAERRKEAIRSAVASLHAQGITSYTEPGLGPGGTEILGGDLRAADPHDIPAIPIDLTVFDGRVVYER